MTDPAPVPVPSIYFAWLDPLRGFAALSVLAAHLVMLAALPIPTWYPVAWFRIGFLGVDLFFAISGAVILFSLAELERRYPGGFRRAFAWRRAARIVPLYLLTGAMFVLLAKPDILQRADAAQVVLAHLFFVQNLFVSTHGAINGPSWTLGVEMQFYLLVLLVGPWLLRLRLHTLAAIGLVIGLGWRTAVWWWLSQDPASADSNRMFIYSTQLPGVLDEFVAGMLAVRWLMQRREQGHPPSARSAVRLGLGALIAWSLAIALMHQHVDDFWTHPTTVIGLRSLLALATGLSVAAALALPAPHRRIPGLRSSGDLSYGIYLWHMGMLLVLQGLWPAAEPWCFALAVLVATVAMSWLAWVLVERPVMHWARRRESHHVAAAIPRA